MPRPGRYRILAGPGSPYSHKVRAALRYRHIPHDWTIPLGGFDGTGQSEGLKAFGKRLLPVVVYPDGTPWNDSTPILHEMETLHPDGPSLMPPAAPQRFLARLVEDFADEWLAVILMAFRWTSDADVAFCARRQMAGWLGDVDEPALVEEVVDGLLDLMPDATEKEIKARYRRLVQETHPDRLMAQGAPSGVVKTATSKLAHINAAYEEIARERGFGGARL